MISSETRVRVRHRALYRCEYCQLAEHFNDFYSFHVEHIRAKQHGGADDFDNLALACHRCNLHKGTNLAGIDPYTGEIVALFHPRTESWFDHFKLTGARIEGVTPSGRATARLLNMNDERRLKLRQAVLSRGLYL